MTIEDFGGQVASVWQALHPNTRGLVERALRSAPAVTPLPPARATTSAPYDARAEWELSKLLAALDKRVVEVRREDSANDHTLSDEQAGELRRMTETCAAVLQGQAQSAEVFARLIARALATRNYTRIDELADTLSTRLAPSEICQLARHPHPAIRAIAHETLAQSPTHVLAELLNDPVDSDAARDALQSQATEYGSEEARWMITMLDGSDAEEDEA